MGPSWTEEGPEGAFLERGRSWKGPSWTGEGPDGAFLERGFPEGEVLKGAFLDRGFPEVRTGDYLRTGDP